MKNFIISFNRRNFFKRTNVSDTIERKIWNSFEEERVLRLYHRKEFSVMSKNFDNVYLFFFINI